MSKSDTYNLVVVGGGSAGLVSAYIASAVKAKVALVEKNKMGGDCLNTGCVPSKALIRTAKFVHHLTHHKMFGVKSASYELDFKDVMDRVHDVIEKIEPHDSVTRYTDLGVECINGHAEIVDKHTVKVGERIIKTQNIILALGARPSIPPIKGLEKIDYLTSDNLWELQKLPKRLVVLGGGPIGVELTQAFARLGSQVTQVEIGPRILPGEDPDVAAIISETFTTEGVDLRVDTKVTEILVENGDKYISCAKKDRSYEKIPFDAILLAVGRRARTEQLDIDTLGLKLRPNGSLEVDEYMRANGENIFAAGDITGPYQFTHVAAHHAWYCAVNALFRPFKKYKADYRVIPRVTYTDPEVAQVGHNESSAAAARIPHEVTKYDIGDLDRAIMESADHGFVKVITVPGKAKVIGATIVSSAAGELLTEITTAMKHGFGLDAILTTIHPYPTMSEANKYVAGTWKKAHSPAWALRLLEHYHSWTRSRRIRDRS